MTKLRSLLVACTLGMAVAACGESSAPLAPEGARFDGGHGYGSGHDTSGTSTTTPLDTMVATADGGFGFGSGN